MTTPLLATKLYIPPVRPRERVVHRPRLIERLNEGLRSGCKLTLISAPAGFGKTTLLSEWIHRWGARTGVVTAPLHASPHVSWLSLDEGDNDPTRFLAYLIAALRKIEANTGKGVLSALRSPQPPPAEVILTDLINELAAVPDRIVRPVKMINTSSAEPTHELDDPLLHFRSGLPRKRFASLISPFI